MDSWVTLSVIKAIELPSEKFAMTWQTSVGCHAASRTAAACRGVLRPLLLAAVFIAGCSGGGSSTAVPEVAVQPVTFSLSVAAAVPSLTLHPGDTNVPLAVQVGPGSYAGPVTVTLSGLPSGITVSALTLPTGGSGNLLLSASPAADQEAFPPANVGGPTSQSSTINLVAAAGSLEASAPIALTVSITNPASTPKAAQIDLPVVSINTNGAPIIDKTTDVPGTITITSPDGSVSYLPSASATDNTATFHVHGHFTAVLPKLPYHVKLNTSADLLYTMGLSCPYVTSAGKSTCDKSKSYILLANYADKSLLRDWAASALANAIPLTSPYLTSPAGSPSPSGTKTLMPWAPHSLFVELYLNGS
jgi:hypothetical protein